MLYIIIGALAFSLFYLFDANKIYKIHPYLNTLFAIGFFVIIGCTLCLLLGNYPSHTVPLSITIIFGILSAISFILLVYTLFFSIPFYKTYVSVENSEKVVDTGMFALCRHPGVIWFFFLYLFLWIASGNTMIFWAFIIWTIMDIFHILVQDIFFFPKSFSDYKEYRKKTPFLIPNYQSIKRAINSTKEPI